MTHLVNLFKRIDENFLGIIDIALIAVTLTLVTCFVKAIIQVL
jgi:hypothetical protein